MFLKADLPRSRAPGGDHKAARAQNRRFAHDCVWSPRPGALQDPRAVQNQARPHLARILSKWVFEKGPVLPVAGKDSIVERGFIVGAALVGLFSWAPFNSSTPLIASITAMYWEVVDTAAELIFLGRW